MVASIVTEPAWAPPGRSRLFDRSRRPSPTPRILQRPIIGDVFGAGRFTLATRPRVARGLHSVEYLVLEPRRGQVLAVAEDKGAALAMARERITDAERQSLLWPEHDVRDHRARTPRQPSRRRREVYRRSRGRCHYCSDPLQLAGPWHAEHQQPRALGGADDALNLVASCVRCNLAKRDRTALEYVAQAMDHQQSPASQRP